MKLQIVDTLAEIAERSEIVISLVTPAAALDVATRYAQCSSKLPITQPQFNIRFADRSGAEFLHAKNLESCV